MADRPIQTSAEDRLERWPFAERMAKTITNRSDSSSLVIGLYGPWGDGKTSVLNLLASTLRSAARVVLVRFNPWHFGTEEQLIRAFFATLAQAHDRSLPPFRQKIGNVLEKYGSILALGSATALGGAIQLAPGSAVQEVGRRLSAVELDQLRRRLEEILEKSGKRVVVLMDDIDRLDRRETQAVFRLVKICADFRQTVYVLAFDDEVVAAALAERYGSGGIEAGRGFLEKIVQVPLHLPPADRLTLRQMVFQEIEAALARNDMRLPESDMYEFVRRFIDGLEPALSTPRHVKRYANALAFALPLLTGEVHVGDLMLMEGIRILYPPLYDTIRKHPETFLQSEMEVSGGGERRREEARKIIDQALSALKGLTPAAEGLVHALFPRITPALAGFVVSGQDETWNREKRIASPEYFPRYFQYAIPARDVPDRMVGDIEAHAAAGDVAGVEAALEKATGREAMPRLIEKLRRREKVISPTGVRALSLALARSGEWFPDQSGPFGSLTSTFSQAGILVSNLIKRAPEGVAREDIAHEVINAAEPLPFAAVCAQWLVVGKKDDPEGRVLSPEAEARLRSQVAGRVRQLALEKAPYIAFPRHAPKLLWFWREEAPEEVSDYLKQRFESAPEEATRFLVAYLPRAWAVETGRPSGVDLGREAYDSVARLVDPQVVLAALEAVHGGAIADADCVRGAPEGMSTEECLARQFAAIHRHVVGERTKTLRSTTNAAASESELGDDEGAKSGPRLGT